MDSHACLCVHFSKGVRVKDSHKPIGVTFRAVSDFADAMPLVAYARTPAVNIARLAKTGRNPDALVEDSGVVCAGVFTEPLDKQIIHAAIKSSFDRIRRSQVYKGSKHAATTASVVALTTEGVAFRSAGDSPIVAISADGQKIRLLNIMQANETSALLNFVSPSREGYLRDDLDFLPWEKLEAEYGQGVVIAVMSDGITASHNHEQIAEDIRTLIVIHRLNPSDNDFSRQLVQACRSSFHPHPKNDDVTIATGKKPETPQDQSVFGVFDGLSKGGRYSAITAAAMAEIVQSDMSSLFACETMQKYLATSDGGQSFRAVVAQNKQRELVDNPEARLLGQLLQSMDGEGRVARNVKTTSGTETVLIMGNPLELPILGGIFHRCGIPVEMRNGWMRPVAQHASQVVDLLDGKVGNRDTSVALRGTQFQARRATEKEGLFASVLAKLQGSRLVS